MLYITVQIKSVLNSVIRTPEQLEALRLKYSDVHPLLDRNFKINETLFEQKSKEVSGLI